MSIEIENITRGAIEVRIGARSFTFAIESLLPGFGSPNFVIYSSDVNEVLSDGTKRSIAPAEREQLIAALLQELDSRGLTYDLE
ncbi:MAG: Imm74 family immunity protein [Planctomycetaceae bacterium]